jgi:hypothetical protein
MSKYLEILDLGQRIGKKTNLYQVIMKETQMPIGDIKWYGG